MLAPRGHKSGLKRSKVGGTTQVDAIEVSPILLGGS